MSMFREADCDHEETFPMSRTSDCWNVVTEVNTVSGKRRYKVKSDLATHRWFRSERRAKRAALRLNRRESWRPL